MEDHEETEPGRPEEALEARPAGAVESAMDAIVTVDSEQRIALFNRAAEKTLLCPADEALLRACSRRCSATARRPLSEVAPTRYARLRVSTPVRLLRQACRFEP